MNYTFSHYCPIFRIEPPARVTFGINSYIQIPGVNSCAYPFCSSLTLKKHSALGTYTKLLTVEILHHPLPQGGESRGPGIQKLTAGKSEGDGGPGGLEVGLRPVTTPYVLIQVEESVSLRREAAAHLAGVKHPLGFQVQVLGQDVEEGAVERFVPAPLALQVSKKRIPLYWSFSVYNPRGHNRKMVKRLI